MTSADPYRLPRVVLPRRYELRLEPDLDHAAFVGHVAIDVEVREPTREIALNAAELDIDSATIQAGGAERDVAADLDAETERLTLRGDSEIPAGPARVAIDFRGVLNDKLRGFYRSAFVDDSGNQKILATTQCESTDARRAFPCFDEPDFKARFQVDLVIDAELTAVSNGAEVESRTLDNGRRYLRFAETIPMSTYLVAFVVGNLEITEPVDVGGTPLRIVHQPGKGHLTGFALDVGAHALRFFEDYYGIPYPGEKLDLVAVPDFAFGAMENLGCVIFREALLLVDPEAITQAERIRVADVICHELAHMWFGDLVTMSWWNGIWLNEAFATFMEIAAADAFDPGWRRWEQFGIERSAALGIDALESTRPVEYEVVSPADAEGMFDVLTYQKGGSVLRMLEQYLGDETFKTGIRRYLDTHAYSNTETADLWDSLEATSDEPVRTMMESWIFQGGFPEIEVKRLDARRIAIEQRRFTYDDGTEDASWIVPVLMRAESGDDAELRRVALADRSTEIEFDTPPDRVVLNAGGHGFYRIRYANDLRTALLDDLDGLEAIERFGLVDDAWASVLAGGTSAREFIDIAERFVEEPRVDVWRAVLGGLSSISRLVSGDALARYRNNVAELLAPTMIRLGWDPDPDEDQLTRELRGTILRSLGVLARDADVRNRARRVHADYLVDPAGLDADVIAACVAIVADDGDAGDFDLYCDRHEHAPTPQEQLRYLYALAEFPEEAEFARMLDMTLTDAVRTQNAPYLLARALTHRDHGDRAWEFVKVNWDDLVERFASASVVRMLSGVRALAHFDLEDDVEMFFESHRPPSGEKTLAQYLELLHVTARLRDRERSRLAEQV